jgi:hypothetical protein
MDSIVAYIASGDEISFSKQSQTSSFNSRCGRKVFLGYAEDVGRPCFLFISPAIPLTLRPSPSDHTFLPETEENLLASTDAVECERRNAVVMQALARASFMVEYYVYV